MRRFWLGALIFLALILLLVVPALASSLFPDVPPSHPYYPAIEGMAERGIIGGYLNGNFGPSDLVKRQQFAKMIVLTVGYQPTESDMCTFPDVEHKAGDLYPFHYVAKAASTALTTGYVDGTFKPDKSISRQQVITMAVRAGSASLHVPPQGWSGSFSYADPTHGENVRKAEFNGLLAGVQFADLTANATRGECAQVLYNLLPFVGHMEPPVGDTGTVTSVVDGDTIHVDVDGVEKTVRLLGIDAPETGEPFAAEAKAALENMVLGEQVLLELDVQETDQYGRTLAFVYVSAPPHLEMVNDKMLLIGLATLYTVPPNVKYSLELKEDQDWARSVGAGMWGGPTDSPLEIVSINYDAPGNDNDNLNGEYVTFRVLVSGSLIGYAVEDDTGHRYDFPDRIFQNGQTFKLHTGQGTDTQTDLYWGMSGSAVWNNDGDSVKVLDAEGYIVLCQSYSVTSPTTTSTTLPAPTTTTTVAPTTTTTLPSGGPTVYVTATGTKYHRDGCRYLSSSKIPISLAEAKAQGYGPCSVCNPPL